MRLKDQPRRRLLTLSKPSRSLLLQRLQILGMGETARTFPRALIISKYLQGMRSREAKRVARPRRFIALFSMSYAIGQGARAVSTVIFTIGLVMRHMPARSWLPRSELLLPVQSLVSRRNCGTITCSM